MHCFQSKTGLFLLTVVCCLLCPAFLSAQEIEGTWRGQLSLPNGKLSLVFHIQRTPQGGYTTTFDSPDQGALGIPTGETTFSNATLSVSIPTLKASYKGTLMPEGEIKGTFTQGIPLPLDLQRQNDAKKTQEPRAPFPYRTEEVSILNEPDGIRLAGTLTLPKGGKPTVAVVMVTGSGKQNRDEEIGGHKPFLVIADHLTRHGIAVLRCDDRGAGKSQGDFARCTDEDFARDTEACIRYLRNRKEIAPDCIGIIGHSAGGGIAFRTAARDPKVAFVVSLAGAGVRGDSLMTRQIELVNRSMGASEAVVRKNVAFSRRQYDVLLQTDKSVEEIRKELSANAEKELPPLQRTDAAARQAIRKTVEQLTSPWYLHFMRYDPTADLKRVKCPVLALNGEKDIQVDAAQNLNAIQRKITSNGNRQVTVKAYPGLNHLFQTCKECTVSEYAYLPETFSPQVLDDITRWITTVMQKKK